MKVNIKKEFTTQFLGTVALDILHDCRECYIPNGTLKQLTDILTYSIYSNNKDVVFDDLKTWVFIQVCKHFCDVWALNIGALGLYNPPNFHVDYTKKVYWMQFFDTVKLPIRSTCTEDMTNVSTTIIHTGGNVSAVNKNWGILYESVPRTRHFVFESPLPELNEYDRYMTVLQMQHNKIRSYFNDAQSLVCLDMKGAAGLIRTITEPFGYVSSIATMMDCGYNMIGMSKLREGSQKSGDMFSFELEMETPFGKVSVFDTDYAIRNEQAVVQINKYTFFNRLPSSKTMSTTLATYLSNLHQPQSYAVSWELILDTFIQKVDSVIPKKQKTNDFFDYMSVPEFFQHLLEQISGNAITPLLIKKYYEYCNQLEVLERENKLIGKSVRVIAKKYKIDRKNILTIVESMYKQYKLDALDMLSGFVSGNASFKILLKQISHDIVGTDTVFKYTLKHWNKTLSNAYISDGVRCALSFLTDYSHGDEPIMFYKYLFEWIFKNKRFIEWDLKEEFFATPHSRMKTRNALLSSHTFQHTLLKNATKNVLGKFMGDFGQMIWCAKHNKIFATEDTNTAAMSLIVHENIRTGKWMTVYGKGDGGSVHIICN